jgi:uncharacterized YigZ family protein
MRCKVKIVYKDGIDEITEKKSRFIARVFSIKEEKQVEALIANIRKENWDARHHCFAYVLGEHNELQRFSDDGEPQGTAGKPILDILVKEDIHNCLIVVTRYFGGTLLGTGGLIRAYQASAKAGIDKSCIVEACLGIQAEIDTEYNNIGKIQYICAERNIHIMNTAYGENVHIELLIPEESYQTFISRITDTFGGKVEINTGKQLRYCIVEQKCIVL